MRTMMCFCGISLVLLCGLTAWGQDFVDATSWPQYPVKGARAFIRGDHLLLRLDAWPASGQVRIPRLNNPCKRAYLEGDPTASNLVLRPYPKEWVLVLPEAKKNTNKSPVLVLGLQGRPFFAASPRTILQRADGSFVLAAHDGVTHGKMLRYEPQPFKNTLGYWVDARDWVHWEIQAVRSGRFRVDLTQGCGKGQGGSEVEVALAESNFRFKVQDTGHFQNFVTRSVGTLAVARPGHYRLTLRVIHLARNAVMDVRRLRLVPRDGSAE